MIIDDQGIALSAEQALLVLVELVCEHDPGAHARAAGLGEPRSRAHRASGTARRSRGRSSRRRTSWRSPGSGGIDFAASQEGGFIWPDVPARVRRGRDARAPPRPARRGRAPVVERCVAEVPEPHVAHEVVPTPWERKGAVMRGVVERAKDAPTVLVDGVKILYPDGWALVLPDPELAVTHVWAEGASDVEARRLVAIHAGQVAELSDADSVRIPAHEHSREIFATAASTSGCASTATSRASASPTSRRTAWATSCSCSSPTSASTSSAGGERQRDRVDEVGLRRLRAGDRGRRAR